MESVSAGKRGIFYKQNLWIYICIYGYTMEYYSVIKGIKY